MTDTQALYRHFSADGTLLYIGVSARIPQRIKEHAKHSFWWKDVTRIEIEHFDDRKSVLEAERLAIINEKPLHNSYHNNLPVIAEPQSSVAISRENITARIVGVRPLYRENKAAEALGISTAIIRKEIANGRLGFVDIESPRTGKPIRHVTGWQLIDWLETMGAKA